MLVPQELIAKKRDRRALSPAEIGAFVAGLTDGRVVDAQAGAMAMAICLNGMSEAETVALTLAMRDSGTVLDWSGLPGPVLDKHSTGGVGDKVSLVLAPLVAACGGYLPMLSGRGLGHTGGTLDKLESIPGYVTRPSLDKLREVVRECGAAIIGQTGDLAPADGRLYAIRDITGTVESISLITASILAKKLAAGPQALVMDVKVGNGAFLPEEDRARALASSIQDVAEGAGLRCRALLTDMSQCLGSTAGNAVEVLEAIVMLRGEPSDPRLVEVTMALATELLLMGNLAGDADDARRRLADALVSGRAAERFQAMARLLGGPGDLVERPDRHLGAAPVRLDVEAGSEGHVTAIDVRALGMIVLRLGGGRTAPDQAVDHQVGLTGVVGLGAPVDRRSRLGTVHARDSASAAAAAVELRRAIEVGPARPVVPALIRPEPRSGQEA